MTAPGWYPDPSGQPGLRWWDGRGWTAQTTAMPAPAARPGGEPPRPGRNWVLPLVLGAAALIVALALVGVFVLRPLLSTGSGGDNRETAHPTATGWDETSTPTPSPTATPSPSPSSTGSGGPPTACATGNPAIRSDHPGDGRIHGGGLSYRPVSGWQPFSGLGMSWGYDVAGQSDHVADSWVAITAVGALRMADGFETPKQSAEIMLQCLSTSAYYKNFDKRRDLVSEAITVDGRPGWRIRAEISVDPPTDGESGDIVDVVAVDTGAGESLGFYTAAAPPDDEKRLALIEAALASLQVD